VRRARPGLERAGPGRAGQGRARRRRRDRRPRPPGAWGNRAILGNGWRRCTYRVQGVVASGSPGGQSRAVRNRGCRSRLPSLSSRRPPPPPGACRNAVRPSYCFLANCSSPRSPEPREEWSRPLDFFSASFSYPAFQIAQEYSRRLLAPKNLSSFPTNPSSSTC
jgi:hypothetical protein